MDPTITRPRDAQVVQDEAPTFTRTDRLKFALPSLLGAALFFVPIPFRGRITIGVGVLAESVQAAFQDHLAAFMTVVLCLSAGIAAYVRLGRARRSTAPDWIAAAPALSKLFDIGPVWLALRGLGAGLALMTLYATGPAWLTGDDTGGAVLDTLVPVLTTWFLFAGFLMPLLLDFGLMEFVGSAFRTVMRPLFTLPGRSSIDAFASWMGAGTVGVLITTRQYEAGYYTQREAAVIGTTFSVSSIAFSLVIASFMGLDHMFLQFYSCVVVSGLVAAVVCPRIPPLRGKVDSYRAGVGKRIAEDSPAGTSSIAWGLRLALEKASRVTSVRTVVRSGLFNVLDIWFGLIPLVMALGTVALVVAEHTPIFEYLSYPLVPVLELLRIPEAEAAAPAMIVGFADMFLPAVIGAGIENELTRFVIACISVTQLIYMSEIGILLVQSEIPIRFRDLVVIFLQRTALTLPIIAVMAHTLFY